MGKTLYEHQKKALQKMHNGCVLCGGVGSGKSLTALTYFWNVECRRGKEPKPLYIITTAVKRDSKDWESEAGPFYISTNPELTLTPMAVDSWNNLHKYEKVKDAFFIFDEQKVRGYGEWSKIFIKIAQNNHWILLSATPGDSWMDYIPIFIANGFYHSKKEFVTRHVVYSPWVKFPKVEKYLDIERLIECKKKVLVEMPFIRRTIAKTELVICDYNHHDFMRVFRGRWDPIDNEPIMNAAGWVYSLRRVVNSDPSRLEHLIDILEEKRKVIVFYNFDYELEILRDGLNEWGFDKQLTIAERNGHRHDVLPETDFLVYLVQYNSGSEAWNCITADTVVFYSLNYAYWAMEQASGRINRANTPFNYLYYYVFSTNSPIDKNILLALKNKKDFNANKFYSRYGKENNE